MGQDVKGKGKEKAREYDGAAAGTDNRVGQPSSAALRNKIYAACAGSVVTALTMTPFDVVKTRLQTQPVPDPLFTPGKHLPGSSSAATGAAATQISTTCCQTTYFLPNSEEAALTCKFDPRTGEPIAVSSTSTMDAIGRVGHMRAGPSSSAAIASAECIYPSSSAAALSLPSASRHLTGTLDALVKIVRYEGPSTLWRGLGPALTISVPGQVVYMVGFDSLRRWMLDNPPEWALRTDRGRLAHIDDHLKASYVTGVPLFAGSFSRTAVVLLLSPIELIRTRMQSSHMPILGILKSIRRTGYATLWRGLPATLWRDVPFSGIYWAGYEGIKRVLTGGKGMGEASEGQGPGREFLVSFASGAGAGMLAATVTNPFDVIKTQRQALPAASSVGTFSLVAQIARKEGMSGLMRGLSPRLAKVGPACGIAIGTYEVAGIIEKRRVAEGRG